jgi:L-asparagine transporter-like permease
MTLCRHLTGGSTVITQGGVFLNYFDPTVGQWTDLIVNSVYFLFVMISLLWVQKCFGKRQFFMFSIPALGIVCFLIAIVMYY